MLGVAEAEESLALRQRVAVQQEPLLWLRASCLRVIFSENRSPLFGITRCCLRGGNGSGIARLPAQQGMLSPLAIARVIGVGPVGLGHGGIILLDAAFHFGKQRVLQAFGVGE